MLEYKVRPERENNLANFDGAGGGTGKRGPQLEEQLGGVDG